MLNYLEYINERLKEAEIQLNILDENEKSEAVYLAKINGIRNIVFEVLDYAINHFPGYAGDSRDLYFPLLKPDDLIGTLETNERYVKIHKILGTSGVNFIKNAYKIIFQMPDKYFLWLDPASKHRNQDEIKKGNMTAIDAKYSSPEKLKLPDKPDLEGFINIQIGTALIRAKNVEMTNTVIKSEQGSVYVDHFYTVTLQQNQLILHKSGGEKSIPVKPFLKNCLDCCKEIITLWSKIE